jgi:hypothetical protein
MSPVRVAVIADLVHSRAQPDRRAAQEALVAALEEVNGIVEAVSAMSPTVGDESQAVYADVPSALLATMLVRLQLPESLDCRFGIGVGALDVIGHGEHGAIQDGPAWWCARDAIIEAKRRQQGRHPSLRTWYLVDEREPGVPAASVTNAYLLCRDQLVSAMNGRSRRLLRGLLLGQTQTELAHAEGITQSAVSQSLRRSGAHALLGGLSLMTAVPR